MAIKYRNVKVGGNHLTSFKDFLYVSGEWGNGIFHVWVSAETLLPCAVLGEGPKVHQRPAPGFRGPAETFQPGTKEWDKYVPPLLAKLRAVKAIALAMREDSQKKQHRDYTRTEPFELDVTTALFVIGKFC